MALISLSALQAGECVVHGPPSFGSVEITAYDRFGFAVSPAPSQLLHPDGEVAHRSANGKFARVAYGTYNVRVDVSGFSRAVIPLEVAQEVVHARVPLSVGAIGCPFEKLSIRGRILPGHLYKNLWLKAMPIRGAGATEAKVGERGSFEVGGLDPGDYFIVVVSDHKIVYQTTYKLHDQQPLQLELPKL